MKNKRIIPTLIVLGIIFTVMGGSLAYYNWQTSTSQRTLINIGPISGSFSCSADGGGDITSGQVNLVPTTCTNSTYAIKRTVTVNTVLNKTMTGSVYKNSTGYFALNIDNLLFK